MTEKEILKNALQKTVEAKEEAELDLIRDDLLNSYADGSIQDLELASWIATVINMRCKDLRKIKQVERLLDNAKELINM